MSEIDRFLKMQRVLEQRLSRLRCAAETVRSRHNVSAILRSCDAFGLQHVHLVGEHFTATKGASRGAERWMNVHRHDTTAAAVRAIKDAGVRLYVADFDDASVSPEQVPLDAPVCIWVGAELAGVSPEAREAADGVVQVPMQGFSQSLNVSVAAAVTLRALSLRCRALGPEALLDDAERSALLQAWVDREDPHNLAVEARASLRLSGFDLDG